MKWLEIIELRSMEKHQALVQLWLTDLMTITTENDIQSIAVYRNLEVDTDWSIHLHCESNREDTCRSSLGLHLTAALKEFGMVYHSMWLGNVKSKEKDATNATLNPQAQRASAFGECGPGGAKGGLS